jgi:NADH-quinone oxidoreductase subunit L
VTVTVLAQTVLAQAAGQPATGAISLIWLVPLLPLAGFAVNLAFGRRLKALSGWIATGALTASFVIAVAALLELLSFDAEARTVVLHGWRWFAGVAFDLRFDPLSATLVLVVTGVGSLIHLYSIGYMAHDERKPTYFAWLNLFAAAMLILVLSQNFLVMFLGWEGVGLCSYLLIGFWFDRDGVPAAAKKAFLANRVGDVGFLLAMFLIYQSFGTLDFGDVFARFGEAGTATATATALLLFLACAGKSAQIPLFVWLPDAMAGPTPVSALIHAATMVTAGVFLVARAHPIFEAAPAAQTTVVLIGAGTALLAAVIAIAQDDIKKILAYSTVSQLGYMFIGVGLGPLGYVPGLFHLVTHAFFKAQLFLGAGSVMHGNDDDVDVKHFGGLRKVMPVTWATMGVAWLAILGIPPLSGFFSKEQVLTAAFEQGEAGTVAWAIGVVTAGLTAFYMSRLFFLTFHGKPRWPEGRHPHESAPVMTFPLIVLALLAAVGGVLNLGPDGLLARFLEPVFAGGAAETAARLSVNELVLTALTVGITVIGAAVAWYMYGSGRVDWLALRERNLAGWRVVADKFYVDEAYELVNVKGGGALARGSAWFDEHIIDGGVRDLGRAVLTLGRRTRRLQNGLVRSYAVGVLAGAAIFVGALVLAASLH